MFAPYRCLMRNAYFFLIQHQSGYIGFSSNDQDLVILNPLSCKVSMVCLFITGYDIFPSVTLHCMIYLALLHSE